MQKVEDSVGKHDFTARAPVFIEKISQAFARKNFSASIHAGCAFLPAAFPGRVVVRQSIPKIE
jgi:hypothetical protein